MRLLLPQALLLLFPVGALLWFGRGAGLKLTALRGALLTALVLALAQPVLSWRGPGADAVVLVDRSRSMPPGFAAHAEELISLVGERRGEGDRLAVVGFGSAPVVEQPLLSGGKFGGFQHPVDAEASDFAAALEAAHALISPERAGRVLLLSDGRFTGLDPRGFARRLAARGVAIDHRFLGPERAGLDVAVVAIDPPPSVSAKEPFQLTATVVSSGATRAQVSLLRDGQLLARGEVELPGGRHPLRFRDRIDAPGLARYQLTVEAAGDTRAENDSGRAVMRVEGPPRVLLLTAQPEGLLARTLQDAGLELQVLTPRPLDLDALDGVAALVLENIEASTLSEDGLQAIAAHVARAGGGLVMTGGRSSFGEGGYRKSAVEELLPVSLELREDERRASVALSVLMDCSCSMGATVPDGRTKMELAAEGVVGALQLLDARDEASVHMVDTQSHAIFAMSPVSAGLPLDKVARGFSGGGGIYVGEALRTGSAQVLASDKATRHVLLFSDAADSEEPDDYRRTLETLRREKVTVSVIGLGLPSDPDAELLREVARLGEGRIYFSNDARSLPRIFSQETLAVARASFVDANTAIAAGPDLAALGPARAGASLSVGGFNLTYLRPRASVAFRSTDERRAPLAAFWPHGTGRTAVWTGEVDGHFTGGIRSWDGYRSLLERLVRWTMSPPVSGGEGGAAPAGIVRALRQGSDLHVTLDLDASQVSAAEGAKLVLLSGEGPPLEVPLRWEDDDRLGVHVTLPRRGTYHPVVQFGGRALKAPPVALAYSPELEPSLPAEGKALLAELSRLTGGAERWSMEGFFAAARPSVAPRPLAPALVVAALLLLLVEVFLRRVMAPRLRSAAPVVGVSESLPPAAPSPPASSPAAPGGDVDNALDRARARASGRLRR
jgi:hypothetical protein